MLARFLVRAEEIQTSVALLSACSSTQLGHRRDRHPAKPTWMAQSSSGVGLVEGWRGTIAHRLEISADGQHAHRLKIVDPSFLNWPALPVALADTIVPDFPLVNKSFNLSYAGNDL